MDYKVSKILKSFNFLTIVTEISSGVTIIPGLLFPNIQYSKFSILAPLAMVVIALLWNKHNGLVINMDFIKFKPIKYLFVLLILQFFISFSHSNITSAGAAFIFGANVYLFTLLVYSLYSDKKRKNQFLFFRNDYELFAGINVLLVCLAAVLMVSGIIFSMSNQIDYMFAQFSDNVENGGTNYFWPGYLTIQDNHDRLWPHHGSLLGLSFEPHVFSYLFVPASLMVLSDNKNKIMSIIIIIMSLACVFLSFSVTTILGLLFVFLLLVARSFFVKFDGKIVFFFLSFLFVIILLKDRLVNSVVLEYINNKVSNDTSSLDYSTGNILDLLTPSSLFGNGIMLFSSSYNGDLDPGWISTIFFVLFYIVTFSSTVKLLFLSSREDMLYGAAISYFFFHGLKLANSVIVMPFTYLILVLLLLRHKQKYESS